MEVRSYRGRASSPCGACFAANNSQVKHIVADGRSIPFRALPTAAASSRPCKSAGLDRTLIGGGNETSVSCDGVEEGQERPHGLLERHAIPQSSEEGAKSSSWFVISAADVSLPHRLCPARPTGFNFVRSNMWSCVVSMLLISESFNRAGFDMSPVLGWDEIAGLDVVWGDVDLLL